MTAQAQHNDHVGVTDASDKGAGQSPLFNINEMGLLPNALAGMHSAAQDTVNKSFSLADAHLPSTGLHPGENGKV
jgi:hypothetical protein